MPKLLQINVDVNWGSTGKIAEQIGLCAMQHGWESFITYAREFNLSKSKVIKLGTKWDVYAHYAIQRVFDNEGLNSIRVTKKLIKEIKEIKPDVIQMHLLHDHYLNYKMLFEYLNTTDIKLFWTFHDCWAFTGHCMHFVTKDCSRWKTGCHNCLMKGEWPYTVIDRCKQNWQLKKDLFAGSKNLHVVACSDWIADFVRESFLKNLPIHVIKNGIDLSRFNIQPLVNDNGKYRILAVSNVWNKEKGIYDIFELQKILGDEYEITMVGLHADQMNTLPEGIVGIMHTQNVQEMVQLYSDADVLINPTYADTFPTINLEALACGTPVITYRTGGSPESVDEITGMVVEQGNVQAMADAIKQLRAKPISQSDCRKRAEEYFDKDKCFEKYIQLYEVALKCQMKNSG